MFRPIRLLLAVLACVCVFAAGAQSFTPKTIRFEGAPGEDAAKLLEISGLKAGTVLTKEQIEAALSRLADTGSFTELSYSVSSDALVIRLGSADDTGMMPVRFANFLWWEPTDLEHVLETEVPLYHGELSLTGSLTGQVEATLVRLARQKGLDLKVTALRDSRGKKVVLSIEHPAIVVGDVALVDAKPAFGPSIADFLAGMRGQELDVEATAATIQQDAVEIYRNAGYLDATVDAPVFAKPRLAPDGRYVVDVTAAAHPGEVYKVRQLEIAAAPPLAAADLVAAAELKPGAVASPMGLLITGQKFARIYADHGYLDADAASSVSLDNVAHTASYTVRMTARAQYHLAGVVAGSLPPEAQAALAADVRLTPGVPADGAVLAAIREDLGKVFQGRPVKVTLRPDRIEHTVTMVVEFATPSARK